MQDDFGKLISIYFDGRFEELTIQNLGEDDFFLKNENYTLVLNLNNISYKLYGMPSVDALNELESFGVNVEIMGCVPPLANTKNYLFQCKDCKHEWFEYEELEYIMRNSNEDTTN